MQSEWPNMKGFNRGNPVNLIKGGSDYFSTLLEIISGVKKTLHLQIYIFNDDATGTMVADALITAAGRGIEIFVLADGYASQNLDKSFIDNLESAGIHFRYFEPFFKSKNYYFGRRLHHKVVVADSNTALVGGINFADRYNDAPGLPAWLDFAVYCKGAIAEELANYCAKAWNEFLSDPTSSDSKPIANEINKQPDIHPLIRMRRNDWISRKNEISSTYIELFRHAKKDIRIVCSYFLPGKIIRRLLSNASKRGVRISVVIAGPSDVMIAKHAERWLYDWLLRHQITLYEYQPTVLHAKMAICDEKLVTVGSYNINNISTYASIELNLDILDGQFASSCVERVENIIAHDCKKITLEEHWKAKHPFIQLMRWASYQFIRISFYLLTFFYKQRRNNE
jgi:cardiolipin synthase A/B